MSKSDKLFLSLFFSLLLEYNSSRLGGKNYHIKLINLICNYLTNIIRIALLFDSWNMDLQKEVFFDIIIFWFKQLKKS